MAQASSLASRIARLVRHRMRDERNTHRVVGKDAVQRIAQRVAQSEQAHSGQVRVCIESSLPASYVMRDATARDRAVAMFGKLRVWDTEHNNGVLVYVLLVERAIEVVADRGVAARVPQEQWDGIVTRMQSAFSDARFEDGLLRAIDEVTAVLTAHFPREAGQAQANELPDEPVLG